MSKKVIFNRSDKSVAQQKKHQRCRSRAKQYIWIKIRERHPAIFNLLITEFNETQAEPYEVKS